MIPLIWFNIFFILFLCQHDVLTLLLNFTPLYCFDWNKKCYVILVWNMRNRGTYKYYTFKTSFICTAASTAHSNLYFTDDKKCLITYYDSMPLVHISLIGWKNHLVPRNICLFVSEIWTEKVIGTCILHSLWKYWRPTVGLGPLVYYWQYLITWNLNEMRKFVTTLYLNDLCIITIAWVTLLQPATQ